MTRSKRIFIIISILFVAGVIYITYDMMSRTTPPWEKRKETIEKYKVK